ncbi:MAG TPA: lipopolysaccharide assembly protein LapA domain-containing protein [Desertimonas sp.]|nr:lipopolysaccharide assembly protein LapA domain-containing protein [Desertimonas sp.]
MHEQAENGGPDVKISEQGSMARWIIIGIAAICAVVFVLQNSEKVTIHFLFIEVSARVWVGFVICLALGALLGALIGRWWRRRQLQ